MSATKNQNQSTDQQDQQQSDLGENEETMLDQLVSKEQFEAMQKQLNELQQLLANQQNASLLAAVEDKGGVWVQQWREIPTLGGRTEKIDERKQYYESDAFDKLNAKDEKDRSGFEYLGIGYKIIEDLRKKKK